MHTGITNNTVKTQYSGNRADLYKKVVDSVTLPEAREILDTFAIHLEKQPDAVCPAGILHLTNNHKKELSFNCETSLQMASHADNHDEWCATLEALFQVARYDFNSLKDYLADAPHGKNIANEEILNCIRQSQRVLSSEFQSLCSASIQAKSLLFELSNTRSLIESSENIPIDPLVEKSLAIAIERNASLGGGSFSWLPEQDILSSQTKQSEKLVQMSSDIDKTLKEAHSSLGHNPSKEELSNHLISAEKNVQLMLDELHAVGESTEKIQFPIFLKLVHLTCRLGAGLKTVESRCNHLSKIVRTFEDLKSQLIKAETEGSDISSLQTTFASLVDELKNDISTLDCSEEQFLATNPALLGEQLLTTNSFSSENSDQQTLLHQYAHQVEQLSQGLIFIQRLAVMTGSKDLKNNPKTLRILLDALLIPLQGSLTQTLTENVHFSEIFFEATHVKI